jgi:hypothetical protein
MRAARIVIVAIPFAKESPADPTLWTSRSISPYSFDSDFGVLCLRKRAEAGRS